MLCLPIWIMVKLTSQEKTNKKDIMAYKKTRSRRKSIGYDLYFGLAMVAGGLALLWFGISGGR